MTRLNRQESRDLTKRRLRDAARAEIAQNGMAAASIDRISEAAGFSRGAFYSNYHTKTELLVELMQEVREREVWIWRAFLEDEDEFEALIPKFEQRFNEYASSKEWRLLTAELRSEAQRNEVFRAAYQESHRRLSGTTLGVGAALQTKLKLTEAAYHTRVFKQIFRALVIGLMLDEGLEGDQLSPGEVVSYLIRFRFNYLANKAFDHGPEGGE